MTPFVKTVVYGQTLVNLKRCYKTHKSLQVSGEVGHMKLKKGKQMLIGCGFTLFLCFLMPGGGLSVPLKNRTLILRSGDLFPSISFPNIFVTEEKKYLGVGDKAILSLGDIQAEVLVIKFLNTNCFYCIKSLPVFKEVFETIASERNLMKRIKMIGIGAGDTPGEVAAFKGQYAVPYPIIPDTEFEAHKAVNEPTVPFIVITRRVGQGKWVVVSVHVGLTFSAESFVGELRAILEIDPNTLKKK